MKKDWMEELASHYESARDKYPQDRLMVLFDIDGTILDTRHMGSICSKPSTRSMPLATSEAPGLRYQGA